MQARTMSWAAGSALALAMVFVLYGPEQAARADQHGKVAEERSKLMKGMGGAMRTLNGFVKGNKSAEEAAEAAAVIAASAPKIADVFPPNTGMGANPESEAKDDIWEEWDAFTAAASLLGDKAATVLAREHVVYQTARRDLDPAEDRRCGERENEDRAPVGDKPRREHPLRNPPAPGQHRLREVLALVEKVEQHRGDVEANQNEQPVHHHSVQFGRLARRLVAHEQAEWALVEPVDIDCEKSETYLRDQDEQHRDHG